MHQYSNSLPSSSISSIHVPGAFETFILNQSVSLSFSLIHSKIHFESWGGRLETDRHKMNAYLHVFVYEFLK